MKRFLTTMILIINMTGCKSSTPLIREVPVSNAVEIREHVVKIPVSDSALVSMLLECSEDNQVLIKRLSEHTTYGSDIVVNEWSDSLIKALEIRFTSHSNAIVKVKDSLIYKEKPVIVEVEKEVNRLKWYQQLLMWTGAVLGCILMVVLIIKIK